jgi:hypothetical protein
MSTCNRMDLQTPGSQPIMPKSLPYHCVLIKEAMFSSSNFQELSGVGAFCKDGRHVPPCEWLHRWSSGRIVPCQN